MEFSSFFAWLSWWLLAVILISRPLLQLTNFKPLSKIILHRKEIGILCGFFAVLHVVVYFFLSTLPISIIWDPNYWNFSTFWGWGFLGFILILPPLLTSNKLSMLYLKKAWKKVQIFVYPAFIFAGLHLYFATRNFFASLLPVFIWASIWIGAKLKSKRKTN